jgi:hypothetical protein
MDTLEFLRAILPESGVHYLALFRAGHDKPQHKAYDDLTKMASAIEAYGQNPDLSVYHACAAFQHTTMEVERNGVTKTVTRAPENWDRAKAFWVDIDCGDAKASAGKGYASQKEAAQAVFQFAKVVGLPRPMLVSSGYGLHAYWPLTKAIKPEPWRKVSSILKASLARANVLADPTRTNDMSSILRPVGAVNRKNGGSRPVRVLSTCEPCDPQELAAALLSYAKENGVSAPKSPTKGSTPDINSDLTAHLPQYANLPVNADLVADKCAQVAEMRDTQGDVSYDHWRRVIGILKHCENGRQKACDWTAQRMETGHAQEDWETRYDTWTTGPSLCAQLEEVNPDGCKGCPFHGKIKTPLVLGRVAPENTDTVEEAVNEEGEVEEVQVAALPHGYVWENGLLCRVLKDKDDVPVALPFSSILFYPTQRIRGEDGTYRIGMRMHLPNKKLREFEMSAEAMASQTDMLRGLAKYELMQTNHKDAGTHMAAYLRDQLEALKRRADELNTLTSFGWKDNFTSFLLGDRLFMADGTTRPVIVSASMASYAKHMHRPKGTVKGYADPLNRIYNRRGMEHWQYAICAGWGSILSPFAEELYKGVLLSLCGGVSGKGKTTACFASLYAFGDASGLKLGTKDGFTQNAFWATLGTLNNMPLVVDELTDIDAKEFSAMAYGVSRGESKRRMTMQGGVAKFAETHTWATSPFITGNKDFHGLLATHSANTQAEAVRMVQIDIDKYPKVELLPAAVPRSEMTDSELAAIQAKEAIFVHDALMEMKSNAGAAGEALVRYVVTNREAVAQEISERMAALGVHLHEPELRYYRSHGACTLVAARIAKDLGIVSFDLDELFEFTVNLLTTLAESVASTNTVTAGEAFSRMMAQLQQRIIVTSEFRDKRHKDGPEHIRNRILGDVAGRYVLGTPNRKEHAGQIMLNQKDVREWCTNNRVDYTSMLNQLESDGALVSRNEKLTLTRGTDIPIVQARCIVVDSLKLDKDALTLVQNKPQSANESAAVAV